MSLGWRARLNQAFSHSAAMDHIGCLTATRPSQLRVWVSRSFALFLVTKQYLFQLSSPDRAIETKLGNVQVGQKKIIFEAIRTKSPGCSSGTDAYICKNGVITFTQVVINVGQGFINNGTFIAPIDGIYHIEVSFNAYQNVKVSMKTTRSNMIFHISDQRSGSNYERTITKTVTLKMEKGDGIYVINESDISYSYRRPIRADTFYPFTFKGFKIN